MTPLPISGFVAIVKLLWMALRREEIEEHGTQEGGRSWAGGRYLSGWITSLTLLRGDAFGTNTVSADLR